MTSNSALSTYQKAPFIYGQNLQRNLYLTNSEEPNLLGIGRFVSQGATSGAIVFFLYAVVGILSVNAYYCLLFIPALPKFLAWGVAIGVFKGLLIWVSSRIVNRRLGMLSRGMLGVLGSAIIESALYLFYPHQSGEKDILSWRIVALILIPGLTMGLVIGSRLDPWRALVAGRRSIAARWDVLARISGLILRLAVLFCFMESILMLICAVRWHSRQSEIVFALLAVGHFVLSSLLVFARLKFVPLSLLAFIVNVPVVAWFLELRGDSLITLYVIFGYLNAWATFLLSRSALMHSAFAALNDEVRYYLID
ncbi:MAG TPA: hypothetical protein VGQ39_13245 [Pyrinomonadaceae bacterium]|jgi:hypothetical protein|nr:hypothetical protein [Pyrinomonadaceae bacterium]